MPSTRTASFDTESYHVLDYAVEKSTRADIIPSQYQEDIYEWFREPSEFRRHRNLVVQARAGSGKTTTILHAINQAPEQNILLCAFNKRIQEELAERLDNPNASALTLHSLGYRAIRANGGTTRMCKRFEREEDIANAVTMGLPYGAKFLVGKLVTKAREIQPVGATVETLVELAYDFNLVPPPGDKLTINQVASAAFYGLKYAAANIPTGIDFSDQIFLPLVHGWAAPDYDMVVVDEAQDMTGAQLSLAMQSCKPGGRIVLVGDDRQAIYGFRGADSESLSRLKRELDADELPLSKTYRCPKSVVAVAQHFVPDFEVDDSAPAGIVDEIADVDELVSLAGPGDFVLSRRNAPLARVALRLLRADKPAKIQGRDIGASLKAMIRQLSKFDPALDIRDFLVKLNVYEDTQRQRFIASKHEDRIEDLADRCETLRWIAQHPEVFTAKDLGEKIDSLFTDDVGAYVICSSVHKAKGLEARHVFLLSTTFFIPAPCVNCGKRRNTCRCREFVPNQSRVREESNIYYVAVTRAKEHLTMCLEKF